jgi:hypothetical protein
MTVMGYVSLLFIFLITGCSIVTPSFSVSIGSTNCASPTVVSTIEITCTIPAGTYPDGAAAVTVQNTDGLSGSMANGFTFVP